jgi:ABC-type amino acid transport substrate-binding protein
VTKRLGLVLLLMSALAFASAAAATATNPVVPHKTLTIGIKVAPPFVIKNGDGTYGGITIDLWRRIASDLGIKYRLVTRDLPGLLK